jgi:hypothetical protein
MPLTLLSVDDSYAVYEDEHGEETMLALPLPIFREVVLWDDFDLESAWFAAVVKVRETRSWGTPDRVAFVESVRQEVADRDSVEIVWCEDCQEALRADAAESIDGGYACTSCYEDNYRSCDDCGVVTASDNMTYTMSDYSVCQRCSDNNYEYCEDCDGYYHESDSSEHRHGGCDCESPAQHFAMRNDGEAPLNQDERVTVALPSGVISAEGVQQIARLIADQGYSLKIDWDADYEARQPIIEEQAKWWTFSREIETSLGAEWQTREGNYTKRLSKLAHKNFGLKIPPAILSQIGNIGRDNSQGVDFEIEITRDLNLSAEEFYHEDSCWWQSYSESRCSLKTNGGIGLRTFGQYGDVQGRAWIMPLKLDEQGELHATFDSMTPDAFMIFNGYGDLSGYAPARIVAHMAGMTYRKVSFDNSPMYVNNSSGYLVANEEIADKFHKRGRVSLHTATHSNLYHTEQAAAVQAAA